MNRKDRRIAAKSGRTSASPALSPATASLWAQARSSYDSGTLREADAFCASVLAAESRHAPALHMRGEIARQQGRPADAITHLTRAVALTPASPALHHALAEAFRAIGKPVDAERHYRRAAELQPDATTLLNHGAIQLALQRPADSLAAFQSALRLDAGLMEAHYGLGSALAALNRNDAADAFAKALALRPDFALAHEGLIRAHLAAGAWDHAWHAATEALRHADTPELRALFCGAIMHARPTVEVPGLRDTMRRALTERWAGPPELASATCAIVASRQPFDPSDPLLGILLELAPIPHPPIEWALTNLRRALLEAAAAGATLPPDQMAQACALARQCCINEYVWDCGPAESEHVDALRRAIQIELDCGLVPSQTGIVVLGMYLLLASLRGAERLLAEQWPPPIAGVLAQQIAEPAEEQRMRGTIPRATPVADAGPDEAIAHPRWTAMVAATRPIGLAEFLAARFPGTAMASLPTEENLDVLVAGCGTGKHAIETARQFAGAQVFAIDPSPARLAYAERMTRSIGVDGITFAQADLRQVAGLGRSFDLIEAVAVLHRMADPWAAWRSLLALLRPGGVMMAALPSARAEGDISQARDWTARRGYPATLEGLRRCRRDLLAIPDHWAQHLSLSPDFAAAGACRDLLFPGQEHAMPLPEVAGFLAREGLHVLGIDAPIPIEHAFRAWSDGSLGDLAKWDAFEAGNPNCFAGMVRLWVRKTNPGPPP